MNLPQRAVFSDSGEEMAGGESSRQMRRKRG